MAESSTKRSRTEYSWRDEQQQKLEQAVNSDSHQLREHLRNLDYRKIDANNYVKAGGDPYAVFAPQTDFAGPNALTGVYQQMLIRSEAELTILHRLNMK